MLGGERCWKTVGGCRTEEKESRLYFDEKKL